MQKNWINIIFIVAILMQFLFPSTEEKVIGSNVVTEDLVKITSITNERSLKIHMSNIEKGVTAVEVCFFVEGTSKEGEIVYQVLDSSNVIHEEGRWKVKDLYSSEEGVMNFTKIYVDGSKLVDEELVINMRGDGISQYTLVGLYGNTEKTNVKIESGMIYEDKTPIFQILGTKKSYPYLWDILLLWSIYFTIATLWHNEK